MRYQWRQRFRTRSEKIVGEVAKVIPGDHLGIHAHNDTEQAGAAIRLPRCAAGVRHIQGTLNGLGERCGNANLVSIIPTLEAQAGVFENFDGGRQRRATSGSCRMSRMNWMSD